jgi:hypothetical protein
MADAFLVKQLSPASLRALNYDRSVEALRRLAVNRKVARVRDLTVAVGRSYGSRFAGVDCEPKFGISLVSQSALFAAEPVTRYIREDSIPRVERHRIHRWQVLIAGAGTLGANELFGRAMIADGRLAGRAIGPHAVALDFTNPGDDEALFAYAYLAGPTGLRAIRSTACGTKILALRLDMLLDLPVPPAAQAIKARVAALVRSCVEHRETFVRELQGARGTIEDLPEMHEAHAMCAERKARAILWSGALPTIGAWNCASPADALQYLQRKWSRRLADALVDDGLYYGARSARIPCSAPYGVEFVSQRGAFLIRSVSRRVLVPGVPTNLVFAPGNSLVIAGRGTLGEGELFGRPTLVAGALRHSGLTEDLLRVVLRPEWVGMAYAFLSTLVGLRLTRSAAVGTKILNLRLDLLRELPFPDLLPERVDGLEKHVASAMAAREEAEAAEAEAIRIVEEEVLPAWLA